MQARFEGRPFVGVPIVTENSGGNPPTAADLDAWANKHDLTGPVPPLRDPGWSWFRRYFDDAENSGAMLIGPQMDIFIKRETYADIISVSEVEDLMPD